MILWVWIWVGLVLRRVNDIKVFYDFDEIGTYFSEIRFKFLGKRFKFFLSRTYFFLLGNKIFSDR